MTRYTCKICGANVVRTDEGGFVRKCSCTNAPVIAHMTATATGEATVTRGK